MGERLGLGVIPGAGWSAVDIRDIARETEAAGFDAIFVAEVNNDALATAQLMGSATARIQVGTWIANIYLRHPYVCAQAAALAAEATGGRFVLGPASATSRSTVPSRSIWVIRRALLWSTRRQCAVGCAAKARRLTCRSTRQRSQCRST
jgi:alkanesulfonate monooxygenase SsuD/methylene tetrahydromethanopterin reductase-like flavin-dependent oxidoreductase (luciferase family)